MVTYTCRVWSDERSRLRTSQSFWPRHWTINSQSLVDVLSSFGTWKLCFLPSFTWTLLWSSLSLNYLFCPLSRSPVSTPVYGVRTDFPMTFPHFFLKPSERHGTEARSDQYSFCPWKTPVWLGHMEKLVTSCIMGSMWLKKGEKESPRRHIHTRGTYVTDPKSVG